MNSAETETKRPVAAQQEAGQHSALPLPPPGIFLRPGFLLRSIFRFLEDWCFSRQPSLMLYGLPAAVVSIGGILFLLFLRHDDQRAAVDRYESAFAESTRQSDSGSSVFFLNALSSLRPDEPKHRYRLALLHEQNGDVSRAFGLMQQLAPLNGDGYAGARVWLIRKAMLGHSLVQLSKEDLEKQLNAASRDLPFDPEVNGLLAQYHASTQQFRLAEQHLRKAADRKPEMFIPLARLQQQLKRDPDLIRASLNAATTYMKEQLTRNPRDRMARIHWSECCAMENQFEEAEAILREGLALEDADELREAMSRLYVNIAIVRLQQSPLNSTMAGRLLIQALAFDPAHVSAVMQLANLPGETFVVPQEQLQKPIDFWQSRMADENPESQACLVLAQLMQICGEDARAIELLEGSIEYHHASRPVLAKLYADNNQAGLANELYDKLLRDLEESGGDEAEAVVSRALLLLHAERWNEAREIITDHRDRLPETARARLDAIHIRVLTTMAKDLMEQEADSSAEALSLLQEAVSVGAPDQPALFLIARLSCSGLSAAAKADAVLSRILADGSFNATVYNFIGTQALNAGQFEKARKSLETAKRLEPTNPMVLNNLALAVSRGPAPDLNYSLTLIESVLNMLPENPDALSTRGEVMMAMGRWEEADRDLQAALPQRRNSVNLRELLIVLCEKLNRPGVAAEHRRILAQLQSDPGVE